jgi:glucosamine-phosphate N-acetyltransferase
MTALDPPALSFSSPVPADFPAILPLLAQLWPAKELDPGKLRQIFLKGLASPRQEYLLARLGAQIIAFGSLTIKNNLWQAGNLAHIDELVVETAFRGRGVGTRMLEELVKLAEKHHSQRIELDSAFHREAAHRFYAGRGFENRGYIFSRELPSRPAEES